MFEPLPMVHVEILLNRKHLMAVAEHLGRSGNVHLSRATRAGGVAPAMRRQDVLALEAWRGLAERVESVMEFYGLEAERLRPIEGPARIRWDTDDVEARLSRIETEVEELQSGLRLFREENARLAQVKELVEPLAFLQTDLTIFREFRHMRSAIGTVPIEILPRLRKGLADYNAILLPLKEVGKRVVILAFASHSHEEVLGYALRSAFFQAIEIPDRLHGTPQAILKTIAFIQEENEMGISALEEERDELRRSHRVDLLELWNLADDNRRTFESIGLFLRTKDAYVVGGWMPARDREKLETNLARITDGAAFVTFTAPQEGEEGIPTELGNPAPLAPFELLTKTYGVPRYRESDPTILLALSSLVMFGAMFADVGHGLCLTLLGLLLAMGPGRRSAILHQAGMLVASAGAAAACFGVLFGSIFGMEDWIRPLWLSPMHEIMRLFAASCAFGALVVFGGIALNVRNALREGGIGRVAFDKFGLTGAVFYGAFLWTGVTLLLKGTKGIGRFHWIALIAPLVVVALRHPLNRLCGWHEGGDEGIMTVVIEAAVEVFETVITYFSNTLSFIRIGAFALCHAGLCQAVYVLAEDVAGGGWLGGLLIVLGNLAIILFEGLIVSIQTMRLEYYEFFTKFFRSGGVRFRPFALGRGENV